MFKRWISNIVNEIIDQRLKEYDRSLSYQFDDRLLFNKIARYVVCESIPGDYYEFGVYRGDSLIRFYHRLKYHVHERLQIKNNPEADQMRQDNWQGMKFYAFDSFQGLPELKGVDQEGDDFVSGQYACSQEEVMQHITSASVPVDRVKMIKGWFDDTCKPETIVEYNLGKAAIIMIDVDLYNSAKTVLEFVEPLLQEGTIIVFDDWYAYKGSPFKGEQKAFAEWSALQSIADQYVFNPYFQGSWKTMSFITTLRQ